MLGICIPGLCTMNALIMHIHNDKDFLVRQTAAQDQHITNNLPVPHFSLWHREKLLVSGSQVLSVYTNEFNSTPWVCMTI